MFPNIYDEGADELILRINNLNAQSTPEWGKMNVSQMLAHLCIAYDMAYGLITDKPPFLLRPIMKWFVKPMVTGPKPYPKNGKTAPVFIISDQRDFEKEKKRLINYIERVKKDGKESFEGRPSPSFGPLTADEWNSLFYKHADHHLRQFGV